MENRPSVLVVYAWNGQEPPLACVRQDAAPQFDLLLFDYSGRAEAPAGVAMLTCATQCKGEIYREVHAWLAARPAGRYSHVGLIDDDIELAWSDLNRLIAIAAEHDCDAFQAALSADSEHDHPRFVARAGRELRWVDWIEVMMPFYRTEVFLAGGAFFARSISSYGLDQFVLPTLHRLAGRERVAVIDAVVVRHGRPITSDGKVFANGLTARQERVLQRRLAMAHVARERPDLLGTGWYFRTFAPWSGPASFWLVRLAAPWLWLRRLLARPHTTRR